MIYLKAFNTEASRTACTDTHEYVSYVEETDISHIHYGARYLTFSILTDGVINFSGSTNNNDITNEIQYSFDGGKTWSDPAQIVTLNVHKGDEIKWKGHMKPAIEGFSDIDAGEYSGIGIFKGSTAKFDVKYDIMSLLYGDDFATNDTLVLTTTFGHLFYETPVVNANQLLLKSQNLTNYCYFRMFESCSELVKMPYLPAENLAIYCYFEMFNGCTKLKKTTDLPAEIMQESCYHRMFGSCSSLVKAPVLMAVTMAPHCYEGMFGFCTSLTTPPRLDSTALAKGCYDHMFANCSSLLTAPELPATTLAASAYTHMFADCVSLTEAPKLKATTLTSGSEDQRCYRRMFSGCTNLNYIYALHTTVPNDNDSRNQFTQEWVLNVGSTGIFVQNINATWGVSGTNYSSGSGLPSGWTIILLYVKGGRNEI